MYRRRQYEAAMQAFIAAHRFAPLPEVLYNLAVTAEKLGSRQDAIDYYREYLRSLPENAPDRGAIEREIRRLRGGS
jgi:tetratricopeptide (TPR) repeat protein